MTRAYVDAVRGVDSSYAVSSLVERGLIEAKGRLDAPGRPVLFGTTSSFLRCFGLESIADLPDLPNDEIATVFQTVQDRLDAEEVDPNQLTIEDAEARAAFEAAPTEPTQETPPDEPIPEGEEPVLLGEEEDALPFTDEETVTQAEPADNNPETTAEEILGTE